MATNLQTKRLLSISFKELAQTTRLSKITISVLCERAQLNRKTFYYHFKDKQDLVNWTFTDEFSCELKKFIKDNAQLPITPNILFGQLAKYFYQNAKYYKRVFGESGQNSFAEYFHSMLYRRFYESFTDCDNEEKRVFLCNFYSDAIVCSIARWIMQSCPIEPEELVFLMKNSLSAKGL